MIEGQNYGASFTNVREACRLANDTQQSVHIVVLDKDLVIKPGTDPHKFYRKTFPEIHDWRARQSFLIDAARSCLAAHLESPCRDGESCGYQLERAITLLKEAHALEHERAKE